MVKKIHMLIFTCMFSLSTVVSVAGVSITVAVPASGEGLKKLTIWTPLIKYLEDHSSLRLSLIITKDNRTLKEGLASKNIDLAFIDRFWYEVWKLDDLCVPFLFTERNRETRSILFVNADSIYRSFTDLQGGSLAMTVPFDSAVGFYIPAAILFQRGFDPFSDFRALVFPETFESILKGVAYGKLDSGFATNVLFNNPDCSIYRDKVRVIFESDPLPSPVMVMRKDLNSELITALKQVFLDVSASETGKSLLSDLGLAGFEEFDSGGNGSIGKYLDILEKHNASPK